MAQQEAVKLYSTFVKGLVTEASPLTYPPDASANENNCVIFPKGNRARRLGIDFETGFTTSSFSKAVVDIDDFAISNFKWEAVANTTTQFLAFQFGSTVYFYDLAATPFSTHQKSFTVNLLTFKAAFSTDALVASTRVSFASGNGLLFIASSQIEPIVVKYVTGSDTITSTRIYIQIRDFEGLDDSLANDEEPGSLTKEHHYNLRNQGWFDPRPTGGDTVSYFDFNGQPGSYTQTDDTPIATYFGAQSAYPSNSRQWWLSKNSSGDYQPNINAKIYFGNNLAPRGHYILNAFNKDRSAFSGVASITAETVSNRPPTVSFFAGRVWYACNSTIYYSQVVTSAAQVGMCFQVADPTAEQLSELVASDGGVIQIPEMGQAVKLFSAGSGMLVFGSNGVWFIGGGANGAFSATDFSTSKLTPIGMNSPDSVVAVDSDIYWWSKIGIQGVSQKTGIFGPVQGNFDKVNITDTTIKTFYLQNITELAKQYVKAEYDPANNTIVWLFKRTTNDHPFLYDRVLNLDLTLKAFYPWSFSVSSPDASSVYVCGVFQSPSLNTISDQPSDRRNSYLTYINLAPFAGLYKATFSLIKDSTFKDWKSFSGSVGGSDYMSFVETGYELLQDAVKQKSTPWLISYFKRTEENFVADGDDYTVDHPSSCLLTAKWNWSSSVVSNKWTSPIELYRINRMPTPDASNLALDTGFPLVYNRYKVRGRGRAIQFRFESTTGKDFNLYGWAVVFSGNQKP